MNRTQFPNKAPQPMPGQVKGALAKRSLLDTFFGRPQYQQDDYLKWIALAAGPTQKQQRMDQMLDELEKGGVFKGEPWTPPEKTEPVRSEDADGSATVAKATAAKSPAKAAAKSAPKSAPKAAAAKAGPATGKAGASKAAAKKK